MPKVSRLNLVFTLYLVLAGLVVFGWLPRVVVPFAAIAISVYALTAPLSEVVLFFTRTIPFFVAIPITASFDSLNLWRIIPVIIFLRWVNRNKIKNLLRSRPLATYSLWLIAGLATLSLIQAASLTLAIRRLVYFINLSLIGIVIHNLAYSDHDYIKRLVKNLAIPTVIVITLGFFQLWTTYQMNIFQFVDLWGGVVERNLYGNAWAAIALKANTWFAYFGDRLSLRMFSIFPDSHSFPLFVVFGLAAVMAYALEKVVANNITYKSLIRTRGRIWLLFVPLGFLTVILSGTRGMWLAGGVVSLWAMAYGLWLKKNKTDYFRQAVFWYVSSFLILFVLLFAVAYPIFGSAQFEVSKQDQGLLAKRLRSSFDFSETSNARRIEIWKSSLASIKKHPWLGMGIGNFPVVVGEDLTRAKAGSSAHNLYLHIAAELGVPALLAALVFLWLLLRQCYRNFLTEKDPLLLTYWTALLIFLPWNLFYSFTDVAIFDERAFLMFATTMALILSTRYGKSIS